MMRERLDAGTIATLAKRILMRRPLAMTAVGFFGALVLLAGLDRLFPPPIERGRVVSLVVEDRAGRPLRAFPVEDGRWRLAADLDRLDPAFVDALLRIEDARFHAHPGVDPLAAVRAAGQALARGRIVSGASTITMQTARLLEPRPRTPCAKLIEAIRALQLEARLSKREILELYLTLAPYGGNLQGVRAASWAWFGREPDSLTPDQIALLIALPQSPEARRPDLRPDAARAARAAILDRLAEAGWISAERAADASDEAHVGCRRGRGGGDPAGAARSRARGCGGGGHQPGSRRIAGTGRQLRRAQRRAARRAAPHCGAEHGRDRPDAGRRA